MPKGGARPGAGRPKGSFNKATASIREAAQQYSEQALKTLQDVMVNGDSHAARVAAANSILDRAHGKPGQHIDVDADIKSDVMVTAINLIGKKDAS